VSLFPSLSVPDFTFTELLLGIAEKTKSVFKKWLAFEKQHGDESAAEEVKQRAVSCVLVCLYSETLR
jgi:hypothetical protein